MDIKAYIESGILESYVLRLTSAEETAEVESMIAAHSEIAAAVTDFEINLEQKLMEEAIAPPAFVKEQVLVAIGSEFSDAFKSAITQNDNPARVVTLSPPTSVWKYVAAACIILLLGSGWLNYHFYSKYAEMQYNYNTLLANQGSLMADINANQAKMTGMENIMRVMMDPGMQKLALLPVNKNDTYAATAYWNATTKELYFAQNNLPAAPVGKQYQLWALVKGKPVSAGMIDDCGQMLCKMIDTPEADAFAITLEKTGGSPTPDLTQLKVISKI